MRAVKTIIYLRTTFLAQLSAPFTPVSDPFLDAGISHVDSAIAMHGSQLGGRRGVTKAAVAYTLYTPERSRELS